jgi:uncharacterized protein involved in exopolysaccharide biosynthesis
MMEERPAEWYAVAREALRQAHLRWRTFLAFALFGGAVGGGTALLLPSFYRSGAAFQAETSVPTSVSGTLAGLASQFGNLQLSGQNGAQFFGDLLSTDAVLRRLVHDSFPLEGRLAPLSVLYGLDRTPDELLEYNIVKKLRRALIVGVNVRTGVVRFSVEGRTPMLAKLLADSTLAALNAVNIELRQERAAAERAFTAERATHAREDLSAAEEALTAFYERNRSIGNSPTLQLQEGQLKRQVDMAQQVYVQLRLQEEQAAVQEVRNTPAISVIDPPLVPVKRSWPNRRLAVALGLLVGMMAGVVRVSARNPHPPRAH